MSQQSSDPVQAATIIAKAVDRLADAIALHAQATAGLLDDDSEPGPASLSEPGPRGTGMGMG